MPQFTQGKWWIAPPIFDGDAIYAPAQHEGRRNEVVAMGILNHADAQLIAAAPEMYRLLEEFCKIRLMKEKASTEKNEQMFFGAVMAESCAVNMARELLACINGKEDSHKPEA